jgi:hypothetical protein
MTFAARSTYTAVTKAPSTAGTVHQALRPVAAPRNTRNSAMNPAVPGRPREESAARVKQAATAGMRWANPPIRASSRVCARS